MIYLWPLALQALAFAVLFAEVLIPSLGVLSLIALGLGIWSWVFIVSELPPLGITLFAIADAILIPVAIRYGFRFLGRSPVSHRSDVGVGSGLEDQTRVLEKHIGETAITESPLRPSGKVRVGDAVHEAHTAGEYVENGASVRLIAVRGAEFLVEKI
jgi:membrane-bound ClpP family serine protease